MDRESRVFEDMYRLIGILMGRFMKIHADSGTGDLARMQLGALGILSIHEELPVSELARKLSISKPQATNLVRRLEELGLVRRTGSEADARLSCLWLTPSGEKALNRNMEKMNAKLEEKLSALSAADRAELKRSMESVAGILGKIDA